MWIGESRVYRSAFSNGVFYQNCVISRTRGFSFDFIGDILTFFEFQAETLERKSEIDSNWNTCNNVCVFINVNAFVDSLLALLTHYNTTYFTNAMTNLNVIKLHF